MCVDTIRMTSLEFNRSSVARAGPSNRPPSVLLLLPSQQGVALISFTYTLAPHGSCAVMENRCVVAMPLLSSHTHVYGTRCAGRHFCSVKSAQNRKRARTNFQDLTIGTSIDAAAGNSPALCFAKRKLKHPRPLSHAKCRRWPGGSSKRACWERRIRPKGCTPWESPPWQEQGEGVLDLLPGLWEWTAEFSFRTGSQVNRLPRTRSSFPRAAGGT